MLKALQELNRDYKTVKKYLEEAETAKFELEQAKEEMSIELSQVKMERNSFFQENKILQKKLGMEWNQVDSSSPAVPRQPSKEPLNGSVRIVSPQPTPVPTPASNEKIQERDVIIEQISKKHRLVFELMVVMSFSLSKPHLMAFLMAESIKTLAILKSI